MTSVEATKTRALEGAVGTRKWWALAALAVSGLMVGLDLTVLSLALPTLSRSMHAATSELQWFVDAYSLVFAAVLLPAGLLGDRYGRKKLLLGAMVLFGLASLACAYASSPGELIAARAVLGLGAAFIIPLSMSVLPVFFTPEEQPKAIAIVMVANFISMPIGPIVGGLLLTHFWWGSVFLINVPVVVLALIAVMLLLPESRSAARPRLDATGVLLSSVGLAGLTYGAIEAGQKGWAGAGPLSAVLAGLAVTAAFTLWERRVSRSDGQPLIDLSLFKSRSFTWGAILGTVVTFAIFGLSFTLPQYFQMVIGTNALGSGLRSLPMVGGLLVGSQIGNRLIRRLGAKVVAAAGFVFMAAGLMASATTSVGTSYGFLAISTTVIGVGLGLALPAAMFGAMSSLSKERSGMGTALIMAIRQVGGTIGVAILGTILATTYSSHLDVSGLPAQAGQAAKQSVAAGLAVAHQVGSARLQSSAFAAFVSGMDSLLWVCGEIAVLGVLISVAFLPRRPGAAAAEVTSLESLAPLGSVEAQEAVGEAAGR